MEPKVSIIIPVYNGEKYILDSIQSIINQNYRNIEIVLINDASTDGSHLIISSINDPRIKYLINSKNVGVAESRNRGVLESSGELIAFLDHDDISLADRILMQVKEFENNPKLGLCGTDVQTIGDVIDHIWSYPVDSETLKSRLIFDCPFAAPSVMIRKKCILDRGLKFKAAFPGVDDYEMWVQISKDWELKSIQKYLLDTEFTSHSIRHNQPTGMILLV